MTTHRCPIGDDGLTPCCGRTPFELPRTDRLTEDPEAVDCATVGVELSDEELEALLIAAHTVEPVADLGAALFATVERIIAAHNAQALRGAATDLRANAGPAWGGDRSWLTTGTHVADLAAGWLEERAS